MNVYNSAGISKSKESNEGNVLQNFQTSKLASVANSKFISLFKDGRASSSIQIFAPENWCQ